MFNQPHHGDLLLKATSDHGVRDAIQQLRASGVDWPTIIQALVNLSADIAAKNWPRVIADLLALVPKSTP